MKAGGAQGDKGGGAREGNGVKQIQFIIYMYKTVQDFSKMKLQF